MMNRIVRQVLGIIMFFVSIGVVIGFYNLYVFSRFWFWLIIALIVIIPTVSMIVYFKVIKPRNLNKLNKQVKRSTTSHKKLDNIDSITRSTFGNKSFQYPWTEKKTCFICKGSGYYDGKLCKLCSGTGKIHF